MKIIFAAAIVLTLIAWGANANAQTQLCLPLSEIVKNLKKHGESVIGRFITSNNHLLVLFGDDRDGSWTQVISHNSDMIFCVVAAGTGYSLTRESLNEDPRT